MTRARIRIVAIATGISLSGLLALQGRWLFMAWRDARIAFSQRVARALDNTAERIDPGDTLFVQIAAVVEATDTSRLASTAVHDALTGLRVRMDRDLALAHLARPHAVLIARGAPPAAYWADESVRDTADAHIVRLHRLCRPCDTRIGVIFDDAGRGSVLAAIAGVLVLSVAIVSVLVTCLVVTLTGIARLERENEQQVAFLNHVAHEFQTPIFSISVAGKVLGLSEAIRDDADLFQQVALIARAKDRLAGHTARLLEFARLRYGAMPLLRDAVDLHAVIRRAADDVDTVRETSTGELRLELHGDRDAVVSGNAILLEQAVVNLLDNAFKYGGTPPVVTVRTHSSARFFVIEVEDNGAGIADRHHADIFKPFMRIATAMQHDVKGFGLGLSQVKEIVTRHEGAIALRRTADGTGSVFIVTLPLGSPARRT